MPEGLGRAAFGGTVAGTAKRCGVSEEAMGWRLYNLALVSTAPSARA
jgi:hypothetical protein